MQDALLRDIVGRFGNRHQAAQPQLRQPLNFLRQRERLGRHDAGLGRAAVDVHLQADLQRRELWRALLRQALRNLQPVDAVDPVEVRCHQPGLVALHRTDAVPLQAQARQQRNLLDCLLDVVLAERQLAASVCVAHCVGAEGFRHRQQRDIGHGALRPRTRSGDPLVNSLEIVTNRGHN